MVNLKKILGPRVPLHDRAQTRYRLPTYLFVAAALLYLISFFAPYWRMTCFAPQYPKGLSVEVYLNGARGDVSEIDALNHYIGMKPLKDAAPLERALAIYAIVMLPLLIVSSSYVHTRSAVLLALPALLMPIVFLADLKWWLREFGLHLDPHAALSNSIKPFEPQLFGSGKVGQFATVALPGSGLYLAIAASALILVGFYFHRRAYKPLVDQKGGA